MPHFFIDRPRFASVIALLIILAGLFSLRHLAVEQYPDIAPPTLIISASYPGASAAVVDSAVTRVIEQQLNGVKHLLYVDAESDANGASEITATFKPGTPLDMAQTEVQNRINRILYRLPAEVVRDGVEVIQTSGSSLLMFTLASTDGTLDEVALGDYATRHVADEIRRIPGVGRVRNFGAERAMRVWVDNEKLTAFGLSMREVTDAISAQNMSVSAGAIGGAPAPAAQQFTANIVVSGLLSDIKAFEDIVLTALPGGAMVTLGDVSRVEFDANEHLFGSRMNGKPAANFGVQLVPGANALATASAVKQRLSELATRTPDTIELSTPYDQSVFIDAAIIKVLMTLGEAMVLVFLVMYLFLQNIRYTLIPAIVVPICLLGTLAVMAALGVSVNMLTMFGMVLAIGILVDDAIVVVENVERIMVQEGLAPREATRKAMTQISSAIVGITLVLCAVFLPLALMDGSVGVIYRQFAVALGVSILFSGLLALTLTPALCAHFLRPVAPATGHLRQGVFGWFNRYVARRTARYQINTLRRLKRVGRNMVIYATLVGALALAYAQLPTAFLPTEDQGTVLVDIQLPAGATQARTLAVVQKVEAFLAPRAAVDQVVSITGYSFSGSGQNAALIYVTLKDWAKRDPAQTAEAEARAVSAAMADLPEGRVMAVVPGAIPGLGDSAGFTLRLQDVGNVGRESLLAAQDTLIAASTGEAHIAYLSAQGLNETLQLQLTIDRQKAAAMQVAFMTIADTLRIAFGSANVGDFDDAGRMGRVIVQADMPYRATPQDVLALDVPAAHGGRVSLGAIATAEWVAAPVQLTRYGGYPALTLTGEAAEGKSTGQAMAAITRLAQQLPPGVNIAWTGAALQERDAGTQVPLLLAMAVIVVLLVLVALYESWAIPIAVLLATPLGALGAIAAVWSQDMANDVFFKVGLVAILGLTAKNAILIVEFARALHREGRSLRDAAVEAATLRLRPIIMTSLAFILGVIPLALATGAGAASQRSVGMGVLGGMIAGTVLGVYFVPIFFVWVMKRFKGKQT